jgi:hypothetical protein
MVSVFWGRGLVLLCFVFIVLSGTFISLFKILLQFTDYPLDLHQAGPLAAHYSS